MDSDAEVMRLIVSVEGDCVSEPAKVVGKLAVVVLVIGFGFGFGFVATVGADSSVSVSSMYDEIFAFPFPFAVGGGGRKTRLPLSIFGIYSAQQVN